MTGQKRWWKAVGALEALSLVAFGVALGLVFAAGLDPVALIILLVLAFFAYMARGVWRQAQQVRPVEPPRTWAITAIANLILMALGIGSFGWYLAGAGALAWVPFLIFMAGMMALRLWRRDVTNKLYAWRGPALTLLQRGEYRQVIRALESEATAGRGHPDKLAMVALAYIELNKWERAEQLLQQAQRLAPTYLSVNGALASLRRHQARYAEAAQILQDALARQDDLTSRYYLGLCQYLAGDTKNARQTLQAVAEAPLLFRQGQVMSAYLLGQMAETEGDRSTAQRWYERMAEGAPKVLPVLEEEARRHKDSAYGETLKGHVKAMRHLVAQHQPTPEQ